MIAPLAADAPRVPDDERGAQDRLVVSGPLVVDLDSLDAWVHGEPVRLTGMEARLLHALARRAGRTVPYRALLAEVWRLPPGDGLLLAANRHMLRGTILRLRQRLGPAAGLVHTVFNRGYRLEIQPAGEAHVHCACPRP